MDLQSNIRIQRLFRRRWLLSVYRPICCAGLEKSKFLSPKVAEGGNFKCFCEHFLAELERAWGKKEIQSECVSHECFRQQRQGTRKLPFISMLLNPKWKCCRWNSKLDPLGGLVARGDALSFHYRSAIGGTFFITKCRITRSGWCNYSELSAFNGYLIYIVNVSM